VSASRTLVSELRTDPRFVAGWLGSERERFLLQLGLDEKAAERLLVCRAPRPQRFAEDVEAIGAYFELDPIQLGAALRQAAVLDAMRSQPTQSIGFLAAARDVVQESFGWRAGPRIRAIAEEFWAAVPDKFRLPRLLERIAPLALPVAVVSLPGLSLGRVSSWLEKQGVTMPLVEPDRPLRGLLFSWRGLSLVFVDGSLSPAERRVSLAHELGHVALDYLRPRARILRDAPELLGVVDGHRSLTADERVRAALEGVPLGVQAHLLSRDAGGAAAAAVEEAEQAASAFAVELLAPEHEVIALLERELSPEASGEGALIAAQRLVEAEYELPPREALAKSRGALWAMRREPGFFDR
jgi:hypothetical protein